MSKWRVVVYFEQEVEADGESDALLQADMDFSFMREASAEEVVTQEEEDDECDIPY